MAVPGTWSDHTITICTRCRGADVAAALRAALAQTLASGFAFRAVDCLAGCDHPVVVGVQASSKATYLFGGIESADEVTAIGDFAVQYRNSRDGWTSAKDRPAALSDKTLARLPALRGNDVS